MNPSADGADRMRQADKVIADVTAKLEAHRREVSRARVIHISCHIDKQGKLEVSLQATF